MIYDPMIIDLYCPQNTVFRTIGKIEVALHESKVTHFKNIPKFFEGKEGYSVTKILI